MDKQYNHQAVEEAIYTHWETSGAFNPDVVKKLREEIKQKELLTSSRSKNSLESDDLPGAQGRQEEFSRLNDSPSDAAQRSKSPISKSFCLIMPPPNANDPLHVGHAMFSSLEDILIRYHRMRGDDTLYQPGADHAGIETQFVFEKKLAKNKQSRFNFDRATLYSMIWNYVQDNADVAKNQLRRLGVSADWSRFKFTLDPDIIQTVLKTFLELNEKKLIYRDFRLVNYCPKCGTAFSDLEVKHEEKHSPLYYMHYGPFIIATTRPETIFGDIAVAVNPKDKRYQQYIGQTIQVDAIQQLLSEKITCSGAALETTTTVPEPAWGECPSSKAESSRLRSSSGRSNFCVKVIGDEFVDMEFGTGVVKITPYHDHHDYEVWQRHKDSLPEPVQIIGFDGRLREMCGKYAGMKVIQAREAIVADLQSRGLIDHTDTNYVNKLNTCYRCGNTLEPLPMAQFFIKVAPLTKPILDLLDRGEFRVHGAGHDKILRHWLENLRDWNISRQIVWGIRQPIWYNTQKNPDISVIFIDKANNKVSGLISELLKSYSFDEISSGLQSLTAPLTASYDIALTAPSPHHLQETDTFDTWFSSAQWPFAALMNTRAGDFARFYPTSVMETGYDILPFWVMRMLMIGFFKTGQLPFHDIYLHGLIRDAKGQKMSKSKGNVVNPLEVADKYGADALRFALVVRSSPGLDKSVGDQDFRAARNLTNKLWNAARFVLLMQGSSTSTSSTTAPSPSPNNTLSSESFHAALAKLITDITYNLDHFQLGLAADTLYDSFWHFFCDQAIEEAKKGALPYSDLVHGLIIYLKLFHPFLPFVTEAIWTELKNASLLSEENDLITSSWPE